MNRITFIVGLLPAGLLGLRAWRGTLGPNPVEALTHETGAWILNFLVLTLAASPLARLIKRPHPLRIRRALGLLSFFYACGHLAIYAWLDKGLDWSEIGPDLLKRRFIWAGLAAFLLLAPLALTSTDAWIRRLGPRWKAMHRLVYPAALLGCLHFYLLVKADVREPLLYAAAVGVLLAYRAVRSLGF